MIRKVLILAMAALFIGPAVLGWEQAAADDSGFKISILSSSPDQVSGGDALVRVDVPSAVQLDKTRVELNGADVTSAFAPEPADHALVGLGDGVVLGQNTLRARVNNPQGTG